MAPKSNGSSTIGMKKSVVAMIAWSSLMRYTAASSLVSMPTSRSGGISPRPPDFAMLCSSTAGASLQPHPPPWERLVRRTGANVSLSFITVPSHEIARMQRRQFGGLVLREPEPQQPLPSSLVHVVHELRHPPGSSPQRL